MADAWSRAENELVVASYVDMMLAWLQGKSVNKAARYRGLAPRLDNRSLKSIEKKHQNVSAALITLGQLWVPGLAPMRNYQADLLEVTEAALIAHPELQVLSKQAVEQPQKIEVEFTFDASLVVAPPEGEPMQYPHVHRRSAVRFVDWLQLEAANRSLGQAGEEFALTFEHKRLWKAGQKSLAERLEHVSATRGDGAGYDIRSFEVDGADRLIEVKTTRLDKGTPFFASRNEVSVSGDTADCYVVYRLFKFATKPQMYHLHGAIAETCRLDPVAYSAVPAQRASDVVA